MNVDTDSDVDTDADADSDADTDADTDSDTDWLSSDCSDPLPDPLPELPDINVDSDDRPLFDHWRDLDCADVEQWYCTSDPDCSDDLGGNCFGLNGDGIGVCASFDIDVWCDGEGEVLSFHK